MNLEYIESTQIKPGDTIVLLTEYTVIEINTICIDGKNILIQGKKLRFNNEIVENYKTQFSKTCAGIIRIKK